MKNPRTHATTLSLMLLLLTGGCASAPRAALPITAEDNTVALSTHPQFQAARVAAPEFVRVVFQTITRLEKEKANAGK